MFGDPSSVCGPMGTCLVCPAVVTALAITLWCYCILCPNFDEFFISICSPYLEALNLASLLGLFQCISFG